MGDLAQPIAMKIVSSVLFAYAKILSAHCPHKDVTSGQEISAFFSENWDWFARNFPLLAPDPSTASFLRNKAQGWYRTNLKRSHNKVKKHSSFQ